MLGRNSHDAETAQIAPWQQKKQKNKPASKPNLGLVVVSAVREAARVPSDLGRNSLDADTCSLECWAETATTPKQRKLRPCDKKNEPASKPKRLGFPVCLGHVFVSVSRAPQAT